MYQEIEGKVVITLERNDYNSLLVMLGMGTGYALKNGENDVADQFLQLANTINQGNPEWSDYKLGSANWNGVDLASRRT